MNGPKPPFDHSDVSSQSGAESATGIFAKVTGESQSEQQGLKQDDDLLRSLLRGEAAPAAGATPWKQVPAAAEPVPSSTPAMPVSQQQPGEFTQIFQALASSPASAAPLDKSKPLSAVPGQPARPGPDLANVFTPVTVGKPFASAPAAARPGAPQPASAGAGEFTQLLRAIQTPEAPSSPEVSQGNAATAPASAPAASSVPIPEATKRAAEPSSFTQMFQSLAAQPAPTPTPMIPEAAPSAKPADAGSFTQLFQSLPVNEEKRSAAPPARATGVESQPAPVREAPPLTPQTPTPAAGPGAFTQMFQSLAPARETVQPAPAPVVPQAASVSPTPAAGPGLSGSGSSSLSSSGPGAFTQVFSQLSSERGQGGGFEAQPDPFASLNQEPPRQQEPPRPGATPFTQSSVRPEAVNPAQGGFTQLFQSLNQEPPHATGPEPTLAPSPAPVAPPVQNPASGGFTQLLRTLSSEPAQAQPFPQAMPQQAASAPMASSGPGEFTRVISNSAFRDSMGTAPASGPLVLPPQQAAPGAAGAGFPGVSLPPAPKFPQMPHAPTMPAAHAAVPPQPPAFQPPVFAFPPPQQPAAAPPAQPAPQSKLQQYLPLILILNVFVLLVIVLILFFVLRHK
jgi:hypothetical protein